MDNRLEYLPKLPYWEHLSAQEKQFVQDQSILRSFKTGEILNSSDTACLGMVYVLSGRIRVSLISEDGREITLFCIDAGDCCITTAACVIEQITFDTLVTAAQDTQLLVLPSAAFARLLAENIYVKAYVYELQTQRFSQSMWVMQQILFKRFDQRLAQYFLSLAEKSGKTDINMTQEEIAREVNSAREVVTRMLRHFSADGLVEITRGRIRITNMDGLRALLNGSSRDISSSNTI